jgi:hypothetical protein
VRADAPGLAFGWSEEVSVDPAGDVEGVDVALSTGGTIEGIVLGPDGRPVADATVRVSEPAGKTFLEQMRRVLPLPLAGGKDPSAETDSSGAFRLSRLPEGVFVLTAAHPAYAPSGEAEVTLPIDGKAGDLRIRLRAPSSLRVRVTERGEPRAGLMVQAIGEGPMKMLATDADGRVEFSNLAPGHCLVQVMEMEKMLAGQLFGARQEVATIEEGKTEEMEISFGKEANVRGRVIGELPRPVGTVVIRTPDAPGYEDIDLSDLRAIILASRHNEGTAMIDADGTFSVPDIPDGDHILEIPRMPLDPGKWAGLSPEERRPYCRGPFRVAGGRDVTVGDIHLGEAPGAPREEGQE